MLTVNSGMNIEGSRRIWKLIRNSVEWTRISSRWRSACCRGNWVNSNSRSTSSSIFWRGI